MNKYANTIFLFAACLRLAGIWLPQLWYDENFTFILARLPLDRMIAATAGDVHPPFWYFIEWLTLRLFPDPLLVPAWTLRLPSALFSLGALAVFSDLLDQLEIPDRAKTIALILMAILPTQLWYGQEARMYALLEFEVLLALYCAVRFNWLGLFVVSVAMLYTQNYSLFYLASLWLVVLVRDTQFKRAMNWAPHHWRFATLAMAGAGVMFLPWVNVIARQMTTINGRYWIQEQYLGDVFNTLYKLFWASAMPSWLLLPGLLVTFMGLGFGAYCLIVSKHRERDTILLMAFAPLGMAWIVSELWQPILLFRPLIGISPFLYLIVAWGLDQLIGQRQFRAWREAALASALAVPLFVAGIGGYYINIPDMKSDGAVSPLSSALAYVQANWQPGDIIYYTDDGPMINLLPYAGGLPQYEMAACGDRLNVGPVLGSLSPITRDAIGVPVAELSDLDYTRAWVFAPRSPLHPQCYEDHIASITAGDPLIVVDDNEFIFSGVWLVVRDE